MIVKEIRFPDDISYGSSGGPAYNTLVPQTGSGYEDTLSLWSAARHRYDVGYGIRTYDKIEQVIAFFHAVRGRAFAFRYKDWADYKSCAVDATPSATDQALGTGDGAVVAFQLWKTYAYGAESYARKITKPVAGTVRASIQGVTDSRWTASTVTGVVTFSADITKSISAITQAAQGKITFTASHTLSVGNTFHVSAVAGMTAINGKRVTVLAVDSATQVTTDHNTSGYSAYTSGGTIHTIPQSGEAVKAGFEFDVPVRFEQDSLNVSLDNLKVGAADVTLVEVRV